VSNIYKFLIKFTTFTHFLSFQATKLKNETNPLPEIPNKPKRKRNSKKEIEFTSAVRSREGKPETLQTVPVPLNRVGCYGRPGGSVSKRSSE
jgi:hypothetical protein